VNIGF